MGQTLVVLRRLSSGISSGLGGLFSNIALFLVDNIFFIFNLITPGRPKGKVIQKGCPGYGGKWPEYRPPQQGDSRCSCPALNALANHGILPRDGRNIKFKELGPIIRDSYNFASTFCYFVPNYAANMLGRQYATDAFDLADIDAHNCIEHDASLCRVDAHEDPDQGKISLPLVERVLKCGTGPHGNMTKKDLSRLLGERRVEAKAANPEYSQALVHKLFGSSNSSTLLTIFGGRMDDLRPFLTEERIPDGWEPRIRHRMGLTIAEFNMTVLPVELGIKEEVDGAIGAAGRARYQSDAAPAATKGSTEKAVA